MEVGDIFMYYFCYVVYLRLKASLLEAFLFLIEKVAVLR